MIIRPSPILAPAALGLLLAGCAPMGPNHESPKPWWQPAGWLATTPTPARPAPSEPVETAPDPKWWTQLGDPQLTALQERMVSGNLTLRQAGLRLAQARALLGLSEAALLPTANANASYTRDQLSRFGTLALSGANRGATPQTSQNGVTGRSSQPNTRLFQPYDLFQYGFDVSWELDLWGRVRRMVEQAEAQADAAQEALNGAMVTASAELALDYVRLRGLQRKLDITRQNLESARASLRLTRERAQGGLTTDLDVANAAALVSGVEAQLPELERQRDGLINAISLLLGTPPQALTAELAAPRAIPPVPPRVPVGVPADLVRRRPDIREAEANLHAATAATGVAVAEFYPKVTLNGSAAIQGVRFGNLADWAAQTYAFGPAISLPLFDGARLKRNLDMKSFQQQEAAVA